MGWLKTWRRKVNSRLICSKLVTALQRNYDLSRGFSIAIFLVLLLWSVDALVLQAEMGLLDATPMPSLLVKAGLIIIVLIGGCSQAVAGRKSGIPRPMFILWISFIGYLIFETLLLILRFGYPADYVIFSFNAYYFAILLIPFLFYRRSSLDERLIRNALFVVFVPLAILGIVQTVTGNVLLPTESPNQYLQVMSWGFAGSIRAFSLFSSPSTFGHFIALVGALALACVLEKRELRWSWGIVIALVFVCGFCTLTRATQIEIACAMVTVWLVYRRKGSARLISLCPIFYGIVGVIVAFVLPTWLDSVAEADLLSNLSIFQRYAQWASYGLLWIGQGLGTFLFGAGLAQNDRFQPGADVLIDNSFLAVGVHIGFFGVVIWFATTWYVWKYMLEETRQQLTPVRAAAVGAWSVWIFTSVFNVTLFYLLPFALLVLTGAKRRFRVPEPVRAGFARPVGGDSLRLSDANVG
jgi:hypothetical protein